MQRIRRNSESSSQESQSGEIDYIEDPDNEDLDENVGQNKQQKVVVLKAVNKELRSCVICHLIKSKEQFQTGCDNCRDKIDKISNDENIPKHKFYARSFEGMLCIFRPEQSWVAKRFKAINRNIVSGAYALKVDLDLDVKGSLENCQISIMPN